MSGASSGRLKAWRTKVMKAWQKLKDFLLRWLTPVASPRGYLMCSQHGSCLPPLAGDLCKHSRKGNTFYDPALEFTCHRFHRILIIKHEALGTAPNTQGWTEFCLLKGGASNLWTDFNTTSNLQWINYLEQKTLVVVRWCQKLPEMLVSSLKVIII